MVTARVLLQLIVAATRPLSLQEVNIALTLATQKPSYKSYEALDQDLWPQKNFKSIVRNICGLFVSIHDGKVSLIHQTAREFLVRRTEMPELQSGKWQGYLDMATLYTQRHLKVIIKWCRCCSIKGPMSTLKVESMATLCRKRQKEVMTKWCRCCLIKDPISMLEVNVIATLYSCEVYRVPV